MGPLIIISGPSGSGKSTIIRRLLDENTFPLHLSVSVTTRQPRINEQPGVHYHYYTVPEFLDAKEKNEFLEWAEVHGNYYGTLENEVTQYREIGEGVILDIDVQGCAQVRKRCPDVVSIFIRPSRFETLERRLRTRHTESGEGDRGAAQYNARLPELAPREGIRTSWSSTTTWSRRWSRPCEPSSGSCLEGVSMLDELKEEGIVNKVGGRFKLSTLIQKRMVALNTGARPLVDIKTTDKLVIVVQEILQDKIFLDQSGNLATRGTNAGDAVRRAMLTDISDVGGGDD